MTDMTEFSPDHSSSWLKLMTAYEQYRQAPFYWIKEDNTVKYEDLRIELEPPVLSKERDLLRRLLVVNFLSGSDIWDADNTISLIQDALTEVALTEHVEISCLARKALQKIKNTSKRKAIAEKIMNRAAAEAKKEKPDYDIFHNGCLLLLDLNRRNEYLDFIGCYKEFIFLAYGLDEEDLKEMLNALPQKAR